ncbi:hypothetical protein VTO42DRAFT_4882 [Malbranchea cinnamomea]
MATPAVHQLVQNEGTSTPHHFPPQFTADVDMVDSAIPSEGQGVALANSVTTFDVGLDSAVASGSDSNPAVPGNHNASNAPDEDESETDEQKEDPENMLITSFDYQIYKNDQLSGIQFYPSDQDDSSSEPDDTKVFYAPEEDEFLLDDHDEDTDEDLDDASPATENLHLDERYFDRSYLIPPAVPLSAVHVFQSSRRDDVEDYDFDDFGDGLNDAEQQQPNETLERNLTVSQFIRQWFVRSRVPRGPLKMDTDEFFIPIATDAAHVTTWKRPLKIARPANRKVTDYDIQGIPWLTKLKVTRQEARSRRDSLYRSYHNMAVKENEFAQTLPESEKYFQPKAMYTKHKATMEHFQLRNLMSVTSSNTIQYAHGSQIYSAIPFHYEEHCFMDLSDPAPSSPFLDPVRITTMKAKHGVTVVGGFCGEYAYRGEVSDYSVTEGFTTRHFNGITTYIDIFKNRTSGSPQAVISTNDAWIRVLDCETNTIVQEHRFRHAVNCSDTSPDGRLRVIVGDRPDAWIIDAVTGKPVKDLLGHSDYGFACAWSPDMLHIATSNQDRTVNVWDARMWRLLQCIDADVACYRSLRFSPVGGGPRTLLMCEAADRVAIVNAQTYRSRQVLDFFGEIGGADFSPDGGRIWVANMDPQFGGLMEYDRCQWGQEFGVGHTRRNIIESAGDVWFPDLPNEWVRDADLDDDERCVLGPGERKLRFQRLLDNGAHGNCLLFG